MSEKKIKLPFKIIIIVLLVLIIAGSGLFGYYFFTKEDVDKYITKDYLCYIKIPSLTTVYNNLVDLKAGDIITSQGSLRNIYKILLDIRSSKLATNKTMISLLNMKANMIIKKDYSPVLLIDLGFKSILLRISNINPDFIIKLFGEQEAFSVKLLKHDKYNVFQFNLKKSGQIFYISIYKNLLFLSIKPADIDFVYYTKESKNSITNDISFDTIKNQIKAKSMINVYFNTADMLNAFSANMTGLQNVFSKLKYDENSAVSLNISNEKISLNTYTKCSSDDKNISNLLTGSPSKTDIVKYLPLETSLCASLNFESFEDLYKLVLYIEEGKFDKTINTIDNASNLLFKIGINELLFSWIGKEIGVFYANDSDNPVLFVKIKDKNKLQNTLNTIVNSLVIDEDKSLVYDEVELKKIKFPDFIQSVIASFLNKYIDAPYYKNVDDYIFFCMDPAPIANMVRKKDHNLIVTKDQIYQKISSEVDTDSNLFLYFNSGEKLPVFLQNNSIFSSIVKLYEKGIMTVNLNQSRLKIDLSAAGMNIKKVSVYPGFPKKYASILNSNIICKNITGSSLEELIFTTTDNKLNAVDINFNNVNNFPAKFNNNNQYDPIVADIDKDGLNEIYIFTDNGDLYKYDAFGNLIDGYPINTECKDSFNPVILNNSLLFYSRIKNKLIAIDSSKNKQELNFNFKSSLISPPAVFEDVMAFYPKTMSGTIFVTNTSGDILTGWPKDASGVGYGSPVINDIKQYGINNIIFITQSGKLNIWKFDGNPEPNFPIQLEGVYYCQPVIGNIQNDSNKEIAALNKDGLVTLIDSDGKIIIKKQIKDADSKDRKIMLYDVNSDGYSEIIIYGGKDNIIALDPKLNNLPGFPIKGITKPDFCDFNSDGDVELVTSSLDNNIYVYSIPRI